MRSRNRERERGLHIGNSERVLARRGKGRWICGGGYMDVSYERKRTSRKIIKQNIHGHIIKKIGDQREKIVQII